MKFILLYCLLSINGHGYQECYEVPSYKPTHLHQCDIDASAYDSDYKPYKLVCWRVDDEEDKGDDGSHRP